MYIRAQLPYTIYKGEDFEETGVYTAYCPSVNVYSAGETFPEAAKAIRSSVKMHIEAKSLNMKATTR